MASSAAATRSSAVSVALLLVAAFALSATPVRTLPLPFPARQASRHFPLLTNRPAKQSDSRPTLGSNAASCHRWERSLTGAVVNMWSG